MYLNSARISRGYCNTTINNIQKQVSKQPKVVLPSMCSRINDGYRAFKRNFHFPLIMAKSIKYMTNEISNGDLENWLIAKDALFLKRGANQ